jgi:hypothetical protein
MAGIMDLVMGQLSGAPTKQISGKLGADEGAVGNAIGMALPMLLGALSKNASNDDGARSLDAALEKDHDGSILDHLPQFLGNPEAGPGEGILKHVLGAKRPAVEQGIGKSTGLDAGTIGRLLVTLAPVVLGAIGRAKREKHMDAGGLSQFLGGERQEMERRAPDQMGLIGSLLDADGDGQIEAHEIAKGVGLLGKLFGKK